MEAQKGPVEVYQKLCDGRDVSIPEWLGYFICNKVLWTFSQKGLEEGMGLGTRGAPLNSELCFSEHRHGPIFKTLGNIA